MAYLQDGNPRPRAQAENPPPLIPHPDDAKAQEKFLDALTVFFTAVINHATSWADFKEAVRATQTSDRVVMHYLLRPLIHFESL